MSSQNIKSVLVEERSFPPSPEFTARARVKPADLAALHREAAADHLGFWARQARAELRWHKPFTVTLDDSQAPNYRWFTDGELNVSYNCLDVHLEERGHKTAVTFVGEPGDVRHVSYRELHADVCRFANALLAQGVKSGDRVVIYMPLTPEAVVAMHACARIGAIHSVVFGGFSALSLRDRIEDAGAVMLITADGGWRGGKAVELKEAADKALSQGCKTIRSVIVLKRTAHDVPMKAGRDLWWHDVIEGQPPVCEPRLGRRRTSAVPAVHLRLHRQAQGHPAFQRRLSTRREAHQQMGVRSQRRGRVLVHGGHRLGHRPQLCGLRAAGRRRNHRAVRGRAHDPASGPLLADLRVAGRHHLLHRAHRDPRAHETRRRHSGALRPHAAAVAGLGGRAHQSGSLDVVPRERRPHALSDRRYLVADRNRRHHDFSAPRRYRHQARFVHAAFARHRRDHR